MLLIFVFPLKLVFIAQLSLVSGFLAALVCLSSHRPVFIDPGFNAKLLNRHVNTFFMLKFKSTE